MSTQQNMTIPELFGRFFPFLGKISDTAELFDLNENALMSLIEKAEQFYKSGILNESAHQEIENTLFHLRTRAAIVSNERVLAERREERSRKSKIDAIKAAVSIGDKITVWNKEAFPGPLKGMEKTENGKWHSRTFTVVGFRDFEASFAKYFYVVVCPELQYIGENRKPTNYKVEIEVPVVDLESVFKSDGSKIDLQAIHRMKNF